MKKKLLIVLSISLALYFVFINSAVSNISGTIEKTYSPSDEEVIYLSSFNTYKGEGLYKGFSIVYPPGRFLLQTLIFNLTTPSLYVYRFYFNFVPWFFFIAFFFLCYKIFERLKAGSVASYSLATLATFTYFFFITSSQEAHTLAATFFIVALSSFKKPWLKNILLGLILGATFLFRIDTGVLLAISALIFNLFEFKDWQNWVKGFFLIWIPVLFIMLVQGSVQNFFYDVFYLGLIIQPRLMNLPIPPPPVGLVFQAVLVLLLTGAASLATEKDRALKSFALFSLLNFSAALNRSDEGHLWYGAVWLGFYVSYILYKFLDWRKLTKSLDLLIIPLTASFYLLGYLLIKFKNPFVFVIASTVVLFLISRYWKKNVYILLIAGLIATFFTFHSLTYLKLRFQKTNISYAIKVPDNALDSNVTFDKEISSTLAKINNRLDKHNKYLFIYPDYVIFYNYFDHKNPTRYYYHTGETTDKIQNEIINGLEKTNNFLIFPTRVTDNRKAWQWIQKNTRLDSEYEIDGVRVELRKRK